MATQYVHDDTGTYIPATQRPDGTWRKARRVKDGYVPQDEMPLYESKGKQWAKSRPAHPIGLDPCYVADPTKAQESTSRAIPGLDESQVVTTKSSKKKKKKKADTAKVVESFERLDISTDSGLKNQSMTSVLNDSCRANPQSAATDVTKRIRNLRKKLKEINALKQRIESGELKNPEKDQLDKIARKEEVEAEIEALELEL